MKRSTLEQSPDVKSMSISDCSRNSIDDMGHTAIHGLGMAGFGASHKLRAEGLDTAVYDKFAHLGGQTSPRARETGSRSMGVHTCRYGVWPSRPVADGAKFYGSV
jgi:cation diffusion facilitator CzcD-associated flavoprotein CzcO